MKKLSFIFILSLLSSGQSSRANDESFLTDSAKAEIKKRTELEITESEARKSQERTQKFRTELEFKSREMRQRAEDLRLKQEHLKMQIEGQRAENESLAIRQAEIAREIAGIEELARLQEAEALKIKTTLEATKTKLVESTAALEDRRNKLQEQIEKDRTATDKWNEEILSVQAEIVKIELSRFEYEKTSNNLEIQTFGLLSKLDATKKNRDLAKLENEEMFAQLNEIKMKNANIHNDIKTTENEISKLQDNFRALNVEYANESKRWLQSMQSLAQAKLASEQEKLKYDVEKARLENSLSVAKQGNRSGYLELAKSQARTIDAKITMSQARSDLINEIAPRIGYANPKQERKTATVQPLEAKQPKVPSENLAQKLPEKNIESSAIGNSEAWTLKRNCNLYAKADAASKKIGKFAAGVTIQSTQGPTGFIKTVGDDGVEGYVRSSCGDFKK